MSFKAALEGKLGTMLKPSVLREVTWRGGDEAEEAQKNVRVDATIEAIVVDQDRASEIRQALARIEDGSFGICLHCEDAVSPKRLEAIPWAKYCIACQAASEQRSSPPWAVQQHLAEA